MLFFISLSCESNAADFCFTLKDHSNVARRTSAEPNNIYEEDVPLKAVPDSFDRSVLTEHPESDRSNIVSPTSSTGTQTASFFPYLADVSCSENQAWEFEEKLKRAVKETKGMFGMMRRCEIGTWVNLCKHDVGLGENFRKFQWHYFDYPNF